MAYVCRRYAGLHPWPHPIPYYYMMVEDRLGQLYNLDIREVDALECLDKQTLQYRVWFMDDSYIILSQQQDIRPIYLALDAQGRL